MKLSDFIYEVPDELVAQYPVDKRDESKLMVVDQRTGAVEHKIFKNIVELLTEKDIPAYDFYLKKGFKESTNFVFLYQNLK